jgi:hypothetical protein
VKNKIISLVAAVLLTTSAALAEEELADCSQYAELAEVVMQIRQIGGSLQSVLALSEPNTLSEVIILRAWERPRLSNASLQRQIIRDFVDSVYLDCVRLIGR